MELEVDTGNDFDPDSNFLFWKPDTPVLVEPEGMPWRLDPGNDLILNMHLMPSGKPEIASAQVGLYFTDQPPSKQPMLLQLEHDSALDIPAGERNFVVEDGLRLPVDVEVLGIYPHAHYLGKRMEAWATLPDQQKRWLILIPSWDIDRQSVYRYRKPVFLPKGSVLHMRYTYDNSSSNAHNPHNPPVRVKAGNRSEDEMAHLWLQVLPVNTPSNGPDPRLLLEEAWMRNWLTKDPGDIIPLYNLASALAGQGKYQEAIAAYRHALVLHPDDERTLNELGAALENSGDWQQARRTFMQDIGAHPKTCNARFNLAGLELKHDQASAAEQQFRTMLAQCPSDAGVHSGLGVALKSEGQRTRRRLNWALRSQSTRTISRHFIIWGIWRFKAVNLSTLRSFLRRPLNSAPRMRTRANNWRMLMRSRGALATRWSSCAKPSHYRQRILSCTRCCRRRWPAPGNYSRRLRSEKRRCICGQMTPMIGTTWVFLKSGPVGSPRHVRTFVTPYSLLLIMRRRGRIWRICRHPEPSRPRSLTMGHPSLVREPEF